jgi:hypothetical protein
MSGQVTGNFVWNSQQDKNPAFPARVKRMIDSLLMRNFNGNDDTVAVLNRIPNAFHCVNWHNENGNLQPIRCRENYQVETKVAQISANGWVDIFYGHVHQSAEEDNFTHMCLLPSEIENLIAAYQDWQSIQRIKEERRALVKDSPVALHTFRKVKP